MSTFDRNALRAIGALRMIARVAAPERQMVALEALRAIGPPAHISYFSTDKEEK